MTTMRRYEETIAQEKQVEERLRDQGLVARKLDDRGLLYDDRLGSHTTCVVTWSAESLNVPTALEALEMHRRKYEAHAALGVVFGTRSFRKERRGAVTLISYAELLTRVLEHDKAAAIALQEDVELDVPHAYLPRRVTVDTFDPASSKIVSREAIAMDVITEWMNQGKGSLVILGPHGSGKTLLLDEVRRKSALARLEAPDHGPVPVFADRSHGVTGSERAAMAEGVAVRIDTLESALNISEIDRLARQRGLLEAQEDCQIRALPGITVVHLPRASTEEVLEGYATSLRSGRERERTWFNAAIAASEDLRLLAGRLKSFRPMLDALPQAISPFDGAAPSAELLPAFTQALTYAYVDRAIRMRGSNSWSWRGNQLASTLEDAALADFMSNAKAVDSSNFTLSREYGVYESWIRIEDGTRLDEPKVAASLGYSTPLYFASMLVRDALLVRRLVRDMRIGKTEVRDRLRLPALLEALYERELARL